MSLSVGFIGHVDPAKTSVASLINFEFLGSRIKKILVEKGSKYSKFRTLTPHNYQRLEYFQKDYHKIQINSKILLFDSPAHPNYLQNTLKTIPHVDFCFIFVSAVIGEF